MSDGWHIKSRIGGWQVVGYGVVHDVEELQEAFEFILDLGPMLEKQYKRKKAAIAR